MRELTEDERILLSLYLGEDTRQSIVYAHIEEYARKHGHVPTGGQLHRELGGLLPERTLRVHLARWRKAREEKSE